MYERKNNTAKIKSGLKIRTSFVSPANLEALTQANWLPILIIRSINKNPLIAKYSGTPIHMYWLAPHPDLFHSWRDGHLDWDDYADLYADDVLATTKFESLLSRLEILRSTSGAKGIVFLGYGSDPERCHRSILAYLLNQSGLLLEKVKELVV